MKPHGLRRFIGLVCLLAMANSAGCSKPRELGLVDQDASVRVEVLSTKIGELNYRARDRKVKLEPRKSSSSVKNEYIQITIEILNKSESKKLDYTGWCEDSYPRKRAILTDEFGNVYAAKPHTSAVRLSNVEVVGHTTGSLYPGSSMNDVLVYEVPVENAAYLDLELPKLAFDEKNFGSLKLRIPTKSIVHVR